MSGDNERTVYASNGCVVVIPLQMAKDRKITAFDQSVVVVYDDVESTTEEVIVMLRAAGEQVVAAMRQANVKTEEPQL